MLYYASGTHPSINLFITPKIQIEQPSNKPSELNQNKNNKNYGYFRI
jgi:hypothetical protein